MTHGALHSLMQTPDKNLTASATTKKSNSLVPDLFLFLTGSCVTQPIDNLPQNNDEHMFNNLHPEYNAHALIEAQEILKFDNSNTAS